MRKFLIGLAALLLLIPEAEAASTVDPTVPSQNSPLNSGPIRGNFGAVANDINNIEGCFAGTNPPSNPNTFQLWCNTTSAPTNVLVKQFDGSQWITVGTINQATHVYTPFLGGTLSGLTIAGLTVTGSFTATGLVTNADLVSPTVTINGVPCTLGSTCAVTATASSITPGTTGVIGGNSYGLLYQDSGHILQSHATCFAYPAKDLLCNDTTIANGSVPPLQSGTGGLQVVANVPQIQLDAINNGNAGATGAPILSFEAAFVTVNGTYSPILAVPTGSQLGQIWFNGYNGTVFSIGSLINVVTTENWSSGHNGAQWQLFVNPKGTAYSQNSLIIAADWQSGVISNAPLVGVISVEAEAAYNGPAWTTSGIRFIGQNNQTATDTTSTGTVSTGYTDFFGATNIAASSAVTFTNYYGSYFKNPVASTNVTFTNRYAIGADSIETTTLSIAGNLMTFPGVAATLTSKSGVFVNGDCLQASGTNGAISDTGAPCGSGGSTALIVGSTTITSGTPNGLLYDNSGVLGNLATGNNGVLVTSGGGVPSISSTLPSGIAATNMILTTPTLGVATGTSLALGGCSIGTNALCVTGTEFFQTPSPSGTVSNFIISANATTPANVAHPNSIQIVAADNNFADFYIDSFGSFGSVGGQSYRSVVTLRSARGTNASKSAILAGDEFARFSGRAYGTTSFSSSIVAISGIAAQNISDTAQGTFLAFRTTALNTAGGGNIDVPPIVGAFGPSGSLIVGGLQVAASFTGSISGTTLTVSSGTGISIGQVVLGAGVLPNTFITAGSGTSWTVSQSQTVGSEAMTSNNFFATQTANDLGSGIITAQVGFAVFGATSGNSLIQAPATGGGTATLFAGNDTIAGKTVANGGTNCSSASGTCLDNITAFSSTGFIKRTGAGTYTFTADPSDVTSVSNSDSTLTISPTAGAVVASLNLGSANTWTAAQAISGAGFGLTGNISATAWTTSGVRYKNVVGTLTDTTSSGTVAAVYDSVFGGDTNAASSATTYTNLFAAYFLAPVAGTNVTATNKWALGADTAKIGGLLQIQASGSTNASSSIQVNPSSSTSGTENVVSTNDLGTAVLTFGINNSATANSSLANIPNTAVIRGSAASFAGLYIGSNISGGPVVIYQGGTVVATNIAINIVAPGNIQLPHIGTDATKTDDTLCWDTTTGQLYTGTATAGICLGNVSSIRFKPDFKIIADGLSVINALDPGLYHYAPGIADGGTQLRTGYTAERYAEVLPDFTRFDDHGRPNGADMMASLPFAVRAIQQLDDKKVDKIDFQRRVDELAAANDNLREEVGRLQAARH